MQTVTIAIKHAHPFLSVMSRIAHQVFHHQLMCTQQVLLFEGIQLWHQAICLNSIFHFLNLIRCTKNPLTINNICHLFKRKTVMLYCQRRMDGPYLVFLA